MLKGYKELKIWQRSYLATKRNILDLKRDIKETETVLRRDMKEMEMRLTIRLGVMMGASIAVVTVLVKLL